MIPLRPYQQELVDNIRRAIGQGRHSVCAVLGCGGGKSVIQGNIAASATARGNRVLFVVHRKELCQQITNTFAACGVDFSLCTVGMVQTVCRRLAKTPEPKLILVDEAHHILSQSYLSILQHFPGAVVLGFTATPQRMNEGGLGAVFEELIESVSTEWLIQNHYLAPYKYYGVQLADASKLHTKRGDYDKAEIEALMNKRAIFGSAVENWLQLAKGKPGDEATEYLRQKIQQARWVLQCVQRRQGTLQRCLEAMVQAQANYFWGRADAPRPLLRRDLADQLEVHPSTVTRALAHKYLQCRQGLFPTGYFFGRATGAGEISAQQAKAALLRQIRAEDPKKPLSDQALTEALAGEGMPLARRTVAKYRKALGLPPAYRRKR